MACETEFENCLFTARRQSIRYFEFQPTRAAFPRVAYLRACEASRSASRGTSPEGYTRDKDLSMKADAALSQWFLLILALEFLEFLAAGS